MLAVIMPMFGIIAFHDTTIVYIAEHNIFQLSFEGKVFPKIRRKGLLIGSNQLTTLICNSDERNGNDDEAADEPSDYVFRIINNIFNDFVHDQNVGKCGGVYYIERFRCTVCIKKIAPA